MKVLRQRLFWQWVSREIRTAYLQNLTGFAWLLLQPLLLLAVYAFVFTQVFQPRLPAGAEAGFVPFLAVAFWPWTAFSEAVLKASGSITGNAGLIGKVAFATEALPLATVTATFLMHLAGYLVVLLALQALGAGLHWRWLPVVLAMLALLWLLACALALLASALQVFVRDLAQVLPPLMTLWFFTSPILYSPAVLPPGVARWLEWNPMTWFMEGIRGLLLHGSPPPARHALLAVAGVALLAWAGRAFFRRLAGNFEDFL